MPVAVTRTVLDLATPQNPGEAAVALAVCLFEETKSMSGCLAVIGLIQDRRGDRVVVNKPTSSDEMFG